MDDKLTVDAARIATQLQVRVRRAPNFMGRTTHMCVSTVANMIKDLFDRPDQAETLEPIEGTIVLDDFMSVGVTVDGVDYRLVGDRLEVNGTVDPIEVQGTLEWLGFSIPLGNISISGSGGPNP